MKRLLIAILLATTSCGPTLEPAWGRWKPEYAQLEPEVRDWYKGQTMNQATWERLGSPSWHSRCEHGDVFRTQFRVGGDNSDEWWYLTAAGAWKQVPPDVIKWGIRAPDGRATLFIYENTGQELCFYPPEEGI